MSKYYRKFLPVCQGDGPALRQRTGFFPGKSQGSPGFPPGKSPLPAGRTGPSLLHGLNGRLQLFVLLGLQPAFRFRTIPNIDCDFIICPISDNAIMNAVPFDFYSSTTFHAPLKIADRFKTVIFP